MRFNVQIATRPHCYFFRVSGNPSDANKCIETEGVDTTCSNIDVMAAYMALNTITQIHGPGHLVRVSTDSRELFDIVTNRSIFKGRIHEPGRLWWVKLWEQVGLHEVNWVVPDPQSQFYQDVASRLALMEQLRDTPEAAQR